jgi:hypothetical protein
MQRHAPRTARAIITVPAPFLRGKKILQASGVSARSAASGQGTAWAGCCTGASVQHACNFFGPSLHPTSTTHHSHSHWAFSQITHRSPQPQAEKPEGRGGLAGPSCSRVLTAAATPALRAPVPTRGKRLRRQINAAPSARWDLPAAAAPVRDGAAAWP